MKNVEIKFATGEERSHLCLLMWHQFVIRLDLQQIRIMASVKSCYMVDKLLKIGFLGYVLIWV